MKVITNLGMFDLNPEAVVSIRPAPVLADNMDYCDLTYCVEFDDRFYSLDDCVVCVSETDAEKLSELSGVEITGRREREMPDTQEQEQPHENKIKTQTEPKTGKTIFVYYKALFVLNDWEKYFDEKIAWKKKVKPGVGIMREPEPTQAPGPVPSGNTTL